MGLKRPLIEKMTSVLKGHFNKLDNLKMLEFGDQVVRPGQGYFETTGKDLWSSRGINHVSIDVNGKHGSLVKDLTELHEFTEWKDHFNIVYNAGTTEHVEPYKSQYTAFQIADMCCKTGGIMIHALPSNEKFDLWPTHCHYYYKEEFFRTLAEKNNYTIISLELDKTWFCAYHKTDSSNWLITQEELLKGIQVRNEDLEFINSDYSHQKKTFESITDE